MGGPGPGPATIRTTLRVNAAADGDRWTVTVPCEWSQYSVVIPHYGSLPDAWLHPRRSSRRLYYRRRLVIFCIFAAVLVGFLVAKLAGLL